MPRSIQIYVPPEHYEWYRHALNELADTIITDDEAGQRGAKLSVLIRIIATAYIRNVNATVTEMQAIKDIANGKQGEREG